MKKVFLLMIAGIMLSFATQAQKIGHINISQIMTQMPEYKTSSDELAKFAKDFEDQIKTLTTELQTKYNDYLQNEAKLTEAMKEVKQNELNSLNQRVQELNVSAQEKVAQKEAALMEPIAKKITGAIEVVAKEKGYDYILETSATHYANPANDASAAVKAKLGIK